MPTRRGNSGGKSRVTKPFTGRRSKRGLHETETVGATARSIEHIWRRRLPLNSDALKQLHQHVRDQVREHRHGYKTFFVSLEISVLGGLYQVRFVRQDEDEQEWEHQWVSTPGSRHIDDTLDHLDTLLDDTIPHNLSGNQHAWLLRVRVVFYKSKNQGNK